MDDIHIDISVIFVLPNSCSDPTDVSEIMSQAFNCCQKNVANVSWVAESQIASKDLSKTDYLIFEHFEGEAFEKLKTTSSTRILGPWCISVCLLKGRKIPNSTWPIHNVALADCTVTTSHMSKAAKEGVRDLVQKMGGSYTDELLCKTTHLITDSVKSEKYSQAVESGVKIMVPEWIHAVWEASQVGNVNGDDERFAKFRCPIFHKFVFCSTGFSREQIAEKNKIKTSITQNGGSFTGSLVLSKTDILIVANEKLGTSSDKFKAARKTDHIQCVTPDWVKDSLERGRLMPYQQYKVKPHTSTPEKGDAILGPDFSMMSAISGTFCQKTSIEDTMASINASALPEQRPSCSRKTAQKKRKRLSEDFRELADNLDIKRAKMAGQYLDGCSVCIVGFEGDQREKLIKILNLSGAIRYDDISERITHVIVGDSSCPEMRLVRSRQYPASLVTINWLIESMKMKCPADEIKHMVNANDASDESDNMGSPLGKKGLNLLRSKNVLTESDMQMANLATSELRDDEPDESVMMKRYSKIEQDKDILGELLLRPPEVADSKPIELDESDGSSMENCDVFRGARFVLANFDSAEERDFVRGSVEKGGGIVAAKNYRGVADFAVTPDVVRAPVVATATETVNQTWIVESLQENRRMEFAYYHRPLTVTCDDSLEGCVVSISGHGAFERSFLQELIVAMGGVAQDQFARAAKPDLNVSVSTHLVSSERSGRKYSAAIKWGKPVVSKYWLLECVKLGKKAPEEQFYMGSDSTLSHKVSSTSEVTSGDGSGATLINDASKAAEESADYQSPAGNNSTVGSQNVNEMVNPLPMATPVNKLVEKIKKDGGHLTGSPNTPDRKCWLNMDTPETPLARFLSPNSAREFKKMRQWKIDQLPDYVSPPARRLSTPMSELKRRVRKVVFEKYDNLIDEKCVANVDGDLEKESDDCTEAGPSKMNPQDELVNKRLEEISNMLTNSGGRRKLSTNFQSDRNRSCSSKESQPLTVEWDYTNTIQTPPGMQNRVFMLSGIDQETRQRITSNVESLGGGVSNLFSYDPASSHLLSPNPARNEKTLSFMAAGKWILHPSYVEESVKAGKFLDEEDFEFGNPKSKKKLKSLGENQKRADAMHWWRKEVLRRGYGAFNDMRAIVVATKRDPITRVIEAGGGVIVDVKPPYVDTVHATHCLLEPKCVPDFTVYEPLHKQGIHCVNTLYISDFLHRTCNDIKESILPAFQGTN